MTGIHTFRKIASGLFALIVVSMMATGTGAQSSVEQGATPGGEKPVEKQVLKRFSLDDLFDQLKSEADPNKAKRIAGKIWARWSQSGSATIDMLMGWAANAIKQKNWPVAFDLLDQVVVLAPQYAEGWNRRATLYFLRGQYGRSIHDIEQVLKLESRHFGAMAGMGGILQRLNKSDANYQRALHMWNKILEIYPANKNAQKSVVALKEKLAGREI